MKSWIKIIPWHEWVDIIIAPHYPSGQARSPVRGIERMYLLQIEIILCTNLYVLVMAGRSLGRYHNG
ncbi:MAG: hypothetical protein RR475_00600 [Clostridia bacterium]